MSREIFRLRKKQIIEFTDFLPYEMLSHTIAGTELRDTTNPRKNEHTRDTSLGLSKISEEKMLSAGTLLYQGSRAARSGAWSIWFCLDPKIPLLYAGSCPEELGHVNQYRVTADLYCALHRQLPNHLLLTTSLLQEWDIFQKYDALIVENPESSETEVAIEVPNNFLEYVQSLRCASENNFVPGAVKLEAAIGLAPAAKKVFFKNPTQKLQLVRKKQVVEPSDSTSDSDSDGNSDSNSDSDSVDNEEKVKDPYGVFSFPADSKYSFSVVMDDSQRHDATAWAIDQIKSRGNWPVNQIIANTGELLSTYLSEANELRKSPKNCVNPKEPLQTDRYNLPIIYWDCVYNEGTQRSRKLVGGYSELIEFLKYINGVRQ
jgi:hypothetical protein